MIFNFICGARFFFVQLGGNQFLFFSSKASNSIKIEACYRFFFLIMKIGTILKLFLTIKISCLGGGGGVEEE